jgi:hypothetical protein
MPSRFDTQDSQRIRPLLKRSTVYAIASGKAFDNAFRYLNRMKRGIASTLMGRAIASSSTPSPQTRDGVALKREPRLLEEAGVPSNREVVWRSPPMITKNPLSIAAALRPEPTVYFYEYFELRE